MHNNGYNKSSIVDQKLDSEIPHFQDDDDEFLDSDEENETSSYHSTESFTAKTKNENVQENKNLLSKENIDATSAEVQHLIEEVHKSRTLPKVTLEELAIKLLEPKLKEWLNSHLHNLVKEIVEKEIRYITGK